MAFSTFARFQLCAKGEQSKFEGKIEFLTHCSIAVAVKDLNQKTGPTKDYYAMFSVKSQAFFVLHKIGKKRDAEEAVGISKVVDLETCSVRTVNSKMTSRAFSSPEDFDDGRVEETSKMISKSSFGGQCGGVISSRSSWNTDNQSTLVPESSGSSDDSSDDSGDGGVEQNSRVALPATVWEFPMSKREKAHRLLHILETQHRQAVCESDKVAITSPSDLSSSDEEVGPGMPPPQHSVDFPLSKPEKIQRLTCIMAKESDEAMQNAKMLPTVKRSTLVKAYRSTKRKYVQLQGENDTLQEELKRHRANESCSDNLVKIASMLSLIIFQLLNEKTDVVNVDQLRSFARLLPSCFACNPYVLEKLDQIFQMVVAGSTSGVNKEQFHSYLIASLTAIQKELQE